MCYTAILPTVVKAESADPDLMCLTRVFNRWLKMLVTYERLDESTWDEDFNAINCVIGSEAISKGVKRLVLRCRDHALASTLNVCLLTHSLTLALKKMCRVLEGREIWIIKKRRADQGMTERYKPLTKRLKNEKIRKIGKALIYTNPYGDDAEASRLVRRIVEKRAAQTVHRISVNRAKETNLFRQTVRRATSFSLYNVNFAEYESEKRTTGTHWKVVYYPKKGKKLLKAKHSYKSYEEASAACKRYMKIYPEDTRPMSAYRCEHCGNWHIGHEYVSEGYVSVDNDKMYA